MKVRIYENYKKDDNDNITCTERTIDNIECIDTNDNEIWIEDIDGNNEYIKLTKVRYVSDIVIVMDK